MNDLRARLKTSTAEAHRELERDLNLFRSGFTLADYTSLLSRFAGYYSVIEGRLQHAVVGTPHEFVVAERRKLPKLLADLAYCCSISQHDAPYQLADNAPQINGIPAAYGAMYVLEGATLGGQIISRHLRRTLRLENRQGTLFFGSYGSRVHELWQDFCIRLAEWDEFEAEVTATALATFSSLHHWLCTKLESCNDLSFTNA